MKVYSKKVFVSAKSLMVLNKETKQFEPSKGFNHELLSKLLNSGESVGACEVTVEQHTTPGGERGYHLVGNAVMADDDDMSDMTDINARLAHDIGPIAKSDDDIGHESGDNPTLLYALNHDGLPLLYNKRFRQEFAVRSGRVNVEKVRAEAADKALDDFGVAFEWAKVNMPALVGDFSPAGMRAIVAAYVWTKQQ